MAWQDDMVEILRNLIGDTGATEVYTDAQLERVLLVAAFQVLQELDFDNDYSVSISGETLTPDPTDVDTQDDTFVNLVTMKAACIADQGSAVVAAGRAIAVRDGSSSVDLRSVFKSKLDLLKQGWCAVYKDSKREYQMGAGVAGAMVMGPFRLYAYGRSYRRLD